MISIAHTSIQKAKGFMGRDSISEDEAIFFEDIFPQSPFHMNTVKCSIGIASLDNNLFVIDKHIMEPETGSYVTANNTSHVLEAHPDVINGLEIGKEPDWEKLFGASDRYFYEKCSEALGDMYVTSRMDSKGEMVKEIIKIQAPFISDDGSESVITYISEVIGDDFELDSDLSDDRNLFFKEREGDIDRDYYHGCPKFDTHEDRYQLSRKFDKIDIAIGILNDAFGDTFVMRKRGRLCIFKEVFDLIYGEKVEAEFPMYKFFAKNNFISFDEPLSICYNGGQLLAIPKDYK